MNIEPSLIIEIIAIVIGFITTAFYVGKKTAKVDTLEQSVSDLVNAMQDHVKVVNAVKDTSTEAVNALTTDLMTAKTELRHQGEADKSIQDGVAKIITSLTEFRLSAMKEFVSMETFRHEMARIDGRLDKVGKQDA